MSPQPETRRIWGRNPDGTPYVVGLTVAQLRKELDRFEDTDEVCMMISSASRGMTGKLKSLHFGSSQIWLEGVVLDASQE